MAAKPTNEEWLAWTFTAAHVNVSPSKHPEWAWTAAAWLNGRLRAATSGATEAEAMRKVRLIADELNRRLTP